MSLRHGSTFTGIGGVDLGFERAGMESVFMCDNDARCRAIQERHFPRAKRYDDVTTLRGSDAPSVDVLSGGFPCQDVSLAGRRKGLAGERTGLFFDFIRIADECAPRWLLLENVPGLLSSNGGRDMGAILGALAERGYGWAYRVLDAQYFGVAQRRRRVFIVGCLGDAGRAAEVLFEPESCSGDSPPRRAARSGVAALTARGVGTCGADDNQAQAGHLLAFTSTLAFDWKASGDQTSSLSVGDEVSPTITTNHEPAVAFPLAMRGRDDGTELELGAEGIYNALRAGDGGSSRQNLVMVVNGRQDPLVSDQAQPIDTDGHSQVIAFAQNQRDEVRDLGDRSGALAANPGVKQQTYVTAMRWREGKPGGGKGALLSEDQSLTLATGNDQTIFQGGGFDTAVRRLMPVECERLQGFPDGWTDGQPDSARYKQLGNAVCVNVAEWIGRRMVANA